MRLSTIALQHAIAALLSSNASAFTSHSSSITHRSRHTVSSSNDARRRFPVCDSVAKDTTATTTTATTTTATGGAKAGQAEVVLVGCGAPNRGMGWYHATQMLEGRCPSASLDYVVEPWFLGGGGGASGPGGSEFASWSNVVASEYGTVFATSVMSLPPPKRPRLALISGRTADNP